MTGGAEGLSRGELQQEIDKVETDIRRRLPLGWSASYASLVREFVNNQGYSNQYVRVCYTSGSLLRY